jgi:hypothetical protein
LIDGGIDPRYQDINNISPNYANIKQMFNEWYLTENKKFDEIQDLDVAESINIKLLNYFYFIFIYYKLYLVTSPVDFIANISLRRKIKRKDHDKIITNYDNFKSELLLSYEDMGSKSALVNSSITLYECVSYTIEDQNNNFNKVSLYIGDFVTIQEEKEESYAIIKGIIKHKGNDNKYYVFVIINWFEKTNRVQELLECPLYNLQTSQNRRWRCVFPISVIDKAQKVHLIHHCISGRCYENHDSSNTMWIKNNYYFTAI